MGDRQALGRRLYSPCFRGETTTQADSTSGKAKYLACSSVLMGAAFLCKFYGVTLIPLLLVYSIARKRSLGVGLLYLFIPVAIAASDGGLTYS